MPMANDRPIPRPVSPQQERQVAVRPGISAESRAAAYLIAKGFRILARRFRSPVGEIDIIAYRRHLLIFVAVWARDGFAAAWSVSDRQRARMAAAAEAWLSLQGEVPFRDMRLDAVLVVPGSIPRHIPAAFAAG
jgi:putative endonuclease